MCRRVAALVLFFLPILAAEVSLAENDGYFFIGYSKTSPATVDATSTSVGLFGGQSKLEWSGSEQFRGSPVIGGGYRHWIESGDDTPMDAGFGIEGSYFGAEGDNASFDLFPISFIFWLRGRYFTDDENPRGKLNPYLGIGFSYSFISGSVDLDSESGGDINTSGEGLGILAAVGIGYRFKNAGTIFIELRYNKTDVDLEDEPFLWGGRKEINADLETTHLLLGVAF